jgi:oligoendopeptidase F
LPKPVPERADIDAQFKWDLTDMYADAAAWEADRERFLEELPTVSTHRGKLGESGASLLLAIESIQAVETIIANLYVYAGLKSYEDTRISENAARFSEAQGLYSQYQQVLSYFTPELLAIPDETLTQFIERTPGLEALCTLSRRNRTHASLHTIRGRRALTGDGVGPAR